ncbi:MAG TPA: phytanoyl-CoA dioxygenase, partial [Gammaproteobacteria bacterium]|nr:phytanoyl-CoA dioxygenase [Gammaproteobacteria bacterium]
MNKTLSADQHADAMSDYIADGTKRALALNNRSPIVFDDRGVLKKNILDAYWKYGFYIFESAVNTKELADLRQDVERVLNGAPSEPGSDTDRHGRLAVGSEFSRPSFSFATPLSDPIGGTKKNKGRHPVKMLDPEPAEGAPIWTISNLAGNLQIMDSCLRLYGHLDLLAVASAVLGPDFVAYNE